jgi:hypothetical protein
VPLPRTAVPDLRGTVLDLGAVGDHLVASSSKIRSRCDGHGERRRGRRDRGWGDLDGVLVPGRPCSHERHRREDDLVRGGRGCRQANRGGRRRAGEGCGRRGGCAAAVVREGAREGKARRRAWRPHAGGVWEEVGFGTGCRTLYTMETRLEPSDERSTVRNSWAIWAGMGFST